MKKIILSVLIILLLSPGISIAAESYYDKFDGRGNIDWQVVNGNFSVEEKIFLVEPQKDGNKYALAIAPIEISEGVIEAEFTTEGVEGLWYNAFIVLGFRDKDNFCMIGARDGANHWTFEEIKNGNKEVPVKIPEDIDTGRTYKLKVIIKGNCVVLVVDNTQKLFHYSDTGFPGFVGLGVHNAKTYFDNLKIRGIRKTEVKKIQLAKNARLHGYRRAFMADSTPMVKIKGYDGGVLPILPIEGYRTFVPSSLIPAGTMTGDNYKIIQITDNIYPDTGVEIHGSRLAWQALPNNSEDTEIFYYDGEKIHRLTDNTAYECTPSISSGGVAWQAHRSDGGSDVFFYNFDKIKRLTNDTTDDYRITVYGDKLAWCKHKKIEGQVMLYDGKKVHPIKHASAIFPRISAEGIMYSSLRDNHLYLYDWEGSIDLGNVSFEDTKAAHNQQMKGDRLAWIKRVNGYKEVFLYNISEGMSRQITNREADSETRISLPSVNGDFAAWTNRTKDKSRLRLYNGNDVLTVVTARVIDEAYFGEGFLVWAMGKTEENMDIFLYDLTSNEIKQITHDNFNDRHPIASTRYVAWQRFDGNDYEIHMAYIFPKP